jgi:hypothetical protein
MAMVTDELRWPPDAEAVRMVREGLSFAEIQRAVEDYAGRAIDDDVVGAWLSRAALTTCTTHRYFQTVPWRVRPEHASEEPVRMLRLLARRRESFPMTDGQNAVLDAWLAMLSDEGLVVGYNPLLYEGFVYLDQDQIDGPHPDIPIRTRILDYLEPPER